MSLFRVVDKGVVKEVTTKNGRKFVELPKDWDSTHVRVYKLKEVKIL